MKRIIFAFVNPGQIQILGGTDLSVTDLPDQNNYLVIGTNYKKKHNSDYDIDFNTIDNDVLIVVHEKFDLQDVYLLLEEYQIKNPIEVYAIFHKTTANATAVSNEFTQYIGLSYKTFLTQHEVVDSVYYEYVIPLLKSFSDTVFNNLLNEFTDPILEAKLTLLHNCLVPGASPATLPSVLLDAHAANLFQIAYQDFLNLNNSKTAANAFDADFIDSLTKLRKVLLGN